MIRHLHAFRHSLECGIQIGKPAHGINGLQISCDTSFRQGKTRFAGYRFQDIRFRNFLISGYTDFRKRFI